MTLSIIIVNFNARDFVVECCKSIIENYRSNIEKKEFEIIVIDNNSSDGSVAALKKNPQITLIENKENLGFSKANNLGVKKATGDYLLFLNPDTLVYPNTLTGLVNFMEKNKEVGASTCEILLPNGKIDDASHRGFPTPWNALTYFSGLAKIFPHSKIFSGYYQGWKDLESVHEIDSLVGAFMMVRRKAGEDIGWWDEDYFFYGEDIDFCFMLREKGWKVYYVPTFSIIHFKGVSSGIKKVSEKITTADKETKKLAINHRFNAMKIFYKKHYKEKYPSFITGLVILAINLKMKVSLIRL